MNKPGWQFEIGQRVDHREGGWPAVVSARQRAGGQEIYGLVSLRPMDPIPHRTILGEALVPA